MKRIPRADRRGASPIVHPCDGVPSRRTSRGIPSGIRAWALALALAAAAGGASALRGDPSFRVECGYRGISITRAPMPVAVTLAGDEIDREVELRVIGDPEVRCLVELPRATAKRLFLYTTPDPPSDKYTFPEISLVVEGRTVDTATLASEITGTFTRVIPVVGGPSLGLEENGILSPLLDPSALPTGRRGYTALAAIWIYPAAWAQLDRQVLEALWLWTLEGGVILSPARSRSAALSLTEDNPFGPIEECETREHRGFHLAARRYLERAGRDEQIGETDRHGLAELPTDFRSGFRAELSFELPPPPEKKDAGADSASEATAGDGAAGGAGAAERARIAIAVERVFGRGKLVLFAFDPVLLAATRSEERVDWRLFLRALLTETRSRADAYAALAVAQPSWPEASQSDSLWRSVTPQGSSGASMAWFALFLVVYLLLIGPIDYWYVKRSKRPRLTWVTFPITVVVFCIAAWWLGRGRIGLFEQRSLTVIECTNPGADLAWGRSFVGVYSDTNAPLTIRAESPRGEVDPGPAAGMDSVYHHGAGANESLREKMHIWSYHGYRSVWPERNVRLAAELLPPGAERREVVLDEVLPAEPLTRLLATADKKYFQLVPREGGADGRSLFEVGEEVAAEELARIARRHLGGAGDAAFFAALAGAGPLRRDRVLAGHVVAILGDSIPSVSVPERESRGTRRGLAIVRAPVVAARSDAGTAAGEGSGAETGQ